MFVLVCEPNGIGSLAIGALLIKIGTVEGTGLVPLVVGVLPVQRPPLYVPILGDIVDLEALLDVVPGDDEATFFWAKLVLGYPL